MEIAFVIFVESAELNDIEKAIVNWFYIQRLTNPECNSSVETFIDPVMNLMSLLMNNVIKRCYRRSFFAFERKLYP